MHARLLSFVVVLTLLVGTVAAVAPLATPAAPRVEAAPPAPAQVTATPSIAIAPIGTYQTGVFDEGAAEIVTHDPVDQKLYITNALSNTVDVLDISDPTTPTLDETIDLSPYGAGVNSAAFYSYGPNPEDGILAVAVEADPAQDPGTVVFFDRTGSEVETVTVGALPDMLTFTPNGERVLVANEGEPNDEYTVDPEGTVSIIDVSGGVGSASVTQVTFTDFNAGGAREDDLPEGVRIFGPGATVAQDLEPEYIAVSPDSSTAFVTLQENNAVAIIDVAAGSVDAIVALGYKDHSVAGKGLDASDRDDTINIANWPLRGLYQPDAIAAYEADSSVYLVTANEGDSRDYDAFSEEARVEDLTLDETAFPNASELATDTAIGRTLVTSATGDIDDDGAFEELYSFGARSFSIWNGTTGALVFDSADQFEQITAAVYPADFNSTNDENGSFDSRSDAKGPEPEGVTVGTIDDRTYAFVGLERIGGVMVYDISDPAAPTFVQYVNNRDFSGDAEAGTAGDLGPEGLIFISADDSPTDAPLLVVTNEVSGSTTIYAIRDPDGAGTLTLLHNNDGESSLLPIENTVPPGIGFTNTTTVTLETGSVAAFKTLTDQNIAAARAAGNAVVNVYAGDAFLASATLICSLDNPNIPVYDALAQRQIAYDAHILGNHEFDYGPDFLERFIRDFAINGVLNQPFLSANLDFSGEPGFADLVDADGLFTGFSTDGRVVAKSAIVTDELNGMRFGIVSAITPGLPTISSPRNVEVTTADLAETATVVQAEIDRLSDDYGINKIIFVSHLQDIDNDQELIAQLSGVDIAVAGGGDELLTNPAIPDTEQLLPGERAESAGTYPLEVEDADGQTVYIVTTAGNYKYLGRIDAEFDADGNVTSIIADQSYPRRVIPTSQTATDLGLTDAVEPDPGIVETINEPLEACLEDLANTPVARSEVELDVSRDGVRGKETNAGNLIADSFLYVYDQLAADFDLPERGPTNPVIAVQNGGGIRQNAGDVLPVGGAPGTIAQLDTLNVLPFPNFVTVVSNVTPEDLKAILERSAESLPGTGGQFLQVAGIRVVYVTGNPVGSRVFSAVLEDGTPIIENGAVVPGAPSVRVVTNDFTARGGDDYQTFADNPNKLQLPTSYEAAWRTYLRSLPEEEGLPTIQSDDPRYQPGGEGRITILEAEPAPSGLTLYFPIIGN